MMGPPPALALPAANPASRPLTWFSMALRFLGLLTTVSCNSAIFFIFPSMSIFCRRPRTWLRSRRTVSSFPWRLASKEALAEWMAVTQFSRSVWLLACRGRKEGGARLEARPTALVAG